MRALLLLAVLCVVPALAAHAGCTAETQARVNPAFHEAASPQWSAMSEEAEFRRFRLQRVASSVPAYTQGNGRGVVMAVAELAEMASAYTALKQLRATGSTLQVEVAHKGLMKASVADEFESIMGVRVRDVTTAEDSQGLVATAVMASSFEDVLYMSPRTFAVANPESLFASPEFQSTGAVMFPSLYKTSPSNPIWAMVGQSCVDAHEQSGAVFLVSKQKAWTALHVSAHLGAQFYKGLIHGDDSSLFFGALISNTPVAFAPESQAVHARYTVSGSAKVCAHATMMKSFSGVDTFMVAANNEVAMSGANGESLKCLENVQSVAHDDATISSIVALQATVPHNTLVAIQAVCVNPIVDRTTYEGLVSTTYVTYKQVLDNVLAGNTIQLTAPYITFTPNCGKFFSPCASSDYTTTDITTFFFNVSSQSRSANIDVWTPVSQIGSSGFYQYGNETYIRVVDHSGLRDKCNAPGVFGFATRVSNYNIVSGGWAVVAVSWGRLNWPRDILVYVTYNGASNAAFASKVMSAPVLLVAAIVALIAQRLF